MFKFNFGAAAAPAEPAARTVTVAAAEVVASPPLHGCAAAEIQSANSINASSNSSNIETIEVGDIAFAKIKLPHAERLPIDRAALREAVRDSDVVPGVYEGGFKLWECAADLCAHLQQNPAEVRGAAVLDLGCVHALPAMNSVALGAKLVRASAEIVWRNFDVYMHQLTSPVCNQHGARSSFVDAQVCCQDLNEEVLQHVTIPNFRMNLGRITRSPTPSLAAPASSSTPAPASVTSSAGVSEHAQTVVDSVDSGQLPPVHFIAGDWADEALLALLHARGPFDLVLSSDTLYAAESTPHLIGVLKRVLMRPHGMPLYLCWSVAMFLFGGCLIVWLKPMFSLVSGVRSRPDWRQALLLWSRRVDCFVCTATVGGRCRRSRPRRSPNVASHQSD
jgi:hypothetical protein